MALGDRKKLKQLFSVVFGLFVCLFFVIDQKGKQTEKGGGTRRRWNSFKQEKEAERGVELLAKAEQ